MKKQLDPKAKILFFLQYTIGLIFSSFFFLIFFVPVMFVDNAFAPVGIITLGCCVLLLLLMALNYVWAILVYNNYFYELTEDGFRKESGVITKKYVTIPYERIQNVDINRGLLSRFMELSDLQIQTAGQAYAGTPYGLSEGRLPAIDRNTAEELRDELIKRARGKGKSGV